MEENRPFMPPPPPHLRKEPQEQTAIEEERDIANEAVEPEMQKGQTIEINSVASKQKTKLDWNVAINWVGFAVSLVLTALFLFLLIK